MDYVTTMDCLFRLTTVGYKTSLISLSNVVGDTFLPGVSVIECGNLYSQIDSHIIQLALLALLAIVKIQYDAHLTHIRTILSFLRDD